MFKENLQNLLKNILLYKKEEELINEFLDEKNKDDQNKKLSKLIL